jgi:hypothetical protein
VVGTASVEISPNNVIVFEGADEELSAIPRSASGNVLTGRSGQWSSDDPDVASVSQAGVIRGESNGSTTVRVVIEGVEGSAPVTVLPRPEIRLSRSVVSFVGVEGGADPQDQEVQIANTGGGTLSGLSFLVQTEGDHAGWLSASLGSATAPTTLTLSASIDDRPVGVYQGTVLVISPEAHNTPQEVDVTLRVDEPPPVIQLDLTSVRFSAVTRSFQEATQDVAVTNGGGGTLTGLSVAITYGNGPTGWLNATLASSTAPTTLELRASARNLDPGNYTAEVQVSSDLIPGGSRTIDVVFSVSSGKEARR